MPVPNEAWPALPLAAWEATKDTLHMWMQIVGKIRLAQMPLINHWWQVPLYVTARGMTTSPMPYEARIFQIDFDFIDHQLRIDVSDGQRASFPLKAQSVADFYQQTMDALKSLGLTIKIWPMPVEIMDPIPFAEDHTHTAYDPDYAQRFWRLLLQADRVMTKFRSRFIGKVSPVHYFWGSGDLALTRFSGRTAPKHPGVSIMPDRITYESYSHEVSSCGFWAGGGPMPEPIFYSYAYPTPEGFGDYPIKPESAYYLKELGEFVLPYEAVRTASSPDEMLLAFFQSTYEAEATLAKWDRAALERADL